MISLLCTGNNIVNVYCIWRSIPYIRNKLSFMHGKPVQRTFSVDRVSKVFLKNNQFPQGFILVGLFCGSSRNPTCQFKTIGYLSKMFGSSSVSTGLNDQCCLQYNDTVLTLQCAIKCYSVNHNKSLRLWTSVANLQH